MALTTQTGLPLSAPRQGRGGNFKPLVARPTNRSLFDIVTDTEAKLWQEAIAGLLDSGRALLLSPTTDGGAFSVTVLDGDDRSRSYCASPEEVTQALTVILNLCDLQPKAPSPLPEAPRKARSKR